MTLHDTHARMHKYARLAGILYLIIIVFGISGELLVRSGLIVTGDAAATSANILASRGLFRFGFVADAIMILSDVAIAVLFYILLKPVSRVLALTATAFRLTQAAVISMNLLNYYAALLVISAPGYASAMTGEQAQGLALLLLDMHSHGYDLGLVFFGISCLVLGYLLVKSEYFPAVFGYGLAAAGMVYLAGSFTRFLSPSWLSFIEPAYLIPLVVELGFALWLLIKGIREIK